MVGQRGGVIVSSRSAYAIATSASGFRARQAWHKLAVAPWLWPRSHREASLSTKGQLPERPEMTPGLSLLVAVAPEGDCVEFCMVGGAPPPVAPSRERTFAPNASRAYSDALTAAHRTAPVRLRPLSELPPVSPYHVERWTAPGRPPSQHIRTTLDGASFGLAFYLNAGSFAAGVPLLVNVVALATVDPHAKLGPVDGLEAKLAALLACCPAVDTFIVCAEQEALCKAVLAGLHTEGPSIDVLPGERSSPESPAPESTEFFVHAPRSADEALSLAVAGGIQAGIEKLESSRRPASIDSFFALALGDHRVVTHWRGLATTIGVAARCWTGDSTLSITQEGRLHFAHAVAARHAGMQDARLPPFSWTDGQPLSLRHRVLAHYIQDATDRGEHLEPAVEMAAQSVLSTNAELSSDALKVIGAWGRWLAVRGAPEEALACQQRAARSFMAMFTPAQVSHPLCEWFRLAGALYDEKAFADALTLLHSLEAMGAPAPDDSVYLSLWRYSTQLRLAERTGRLDARRAAMTALRLLFENPQAPPHVAFSAARWVVQYTRPASAAAFPAADGRLGAGPMVGEPARTDRDEDDHAAGVAHFNNNITNQSPLAAAFLELSRLPLHESPAAASVSVEAAVSALRCVVPGAVQHLKRAYGGPQFAVALGRWFPY